MVREERFCNARANGGVVYRKVPFCFREGLEGAYAGADLDPILGRR